MTTAIWSKKHKELIADTKVADVKMGKIWKLKNGNYITGAGYYADMVEVVDWFNHGAKADTKPVIGRDSEGGDDTEFLVMDPEGKGYWLTIPYLRMVPIEEDFFTIGTGWEFAIGALEAGATPLQAMKIAAKHDKDTGGKFTHIKIGDKKK